MSNFSHDPFDFDPFRFDPCAPPDDGHTVHLDDSSTSATHTITGPFKRRPLQVELPVIEPGSVTYLQRKRLSDTIWTEAPEACYRFRATQAAGVSSDSL